MKPCNDDRGWPKVAVFDAEADDWVKITQVCHWDEMGHKLSFTGGLDAEGRSEAFNKYIDFLFSDAYQHDLVWSHWGGRYDNRFVISECVKRRYGWSAAMSGPTMIVLTVKSDTGKVIKFCDSGRLMPDSVAKIGKAIGLPKLDLDRNNLAQYTPEQIEEYCFRDCEIILRGLISMREALSEVGCDFAFTLASVATRLVRKGETLEWHKFYDTVRLPNGKVKRVYSPEMLAADKFCLPSYYGGRTEAFMLGMYKNLHLYDIRSAYPWAMTQELPAYFKGYHYPPPNRMRLVNGVRTKTQDIQSALERCGISDVTIWMPENYELFKYPVLPWRDKKHHKVVYPLLVNGNRGCWTNIELLELWNQGKAHGLRMEIHMQALFEPKPFLKPYVDLFFEKRMQHEKAGNEFGSYAYKILLNSMYGKLIETPVKRNIFYGDEMYQKAKADHGIEAIEGTPIPGVYFLTTHEEGAFRHVAAGAYVTALARLRLLRFIKFAEANGANVLYCDTDSLIVDKPVFGDGGKELGELVYEAEIFEAEIWASKVYKWRGRKIKNNEVVTVYKAKGMPIKPNTATDKDFAEEIAEQRWRDFTAPLRGETAEPPKRQGITGIWNDIAKGKATLLPSAYALPRQMRYRDMKRKHHEDGSSAPRVWLDAVEKG